MTKRILLALPAAVLLSACGEGTRPSGFTAALPAPPPAPVAAVPQANDGAIYQASQGYAPLYNGNRAARVGDLVTVVLVESTITNKATGGRTQRDGNAGIQLPPFIGIDNQDLNVSSGASFNGQGTATQTSSLRGDITVTIAEIRPNGTALVRGEKVMQLSQGEEWVQLSGIIRLVDIDGDNRIASIRVADAQISYSGRGAVQRAGRPGWLSRFFSSISPF